MGCRICNILDAVDEDIREQVIEEICNDIAVNHPEMFRRIREIKIKHALSKQEIKANMIQNHIHLGFWEKLWE